jgi:hypothetical protein
LKQAFLEDDLRIQIVSRAKKTTKAAATAIISGWTSRIRPRISLIRVKRMNPNPMPWLMLEVRGIATMIKNEGQNDEALDEDRGHAHLPGNMGLLEADDGKGEHGVEPHARGQGQEPVAHQSALSFGKSAAQFGPPPEISIISAAAAQAFRISSTAPAAVLKAASLFAVESRMKAVPAQRTLSRGL